VARLAEIYVLIIVKPMEDLVPCATGAGLAGMGLAAVQVRSFMRP